MDENYIEQLTNAIGSLGEMSALYFNSLRENGVDPIAAIELTKEFLRGVLPQK